MAALQASNLPGFVDIVEDYQIGGAPVAFVVATALLAGEAVAGIGLFAGRPAAAQVAVVVAVAWSALAVQAFARGLTLDNCGCFGVHLGQPLRWWVLVEDAEFLALALWVRHRIEPRPGAPEMPRARTGLR